MGYDKKKIFEQAKDVIVKHSLVFIEEIVSYLPCDKTTFYRLFNPDSNEYNELRAMIDANKVNIKVSLRKQWKTSDNATLQLALYRLTATQEEHQKLNQQYIEHKGQVDSNIQQTIIERKIIKPNE